MSDSFDFGPSDQPSPHLPAAAHERRSSAYNPYKRPRQVTVAGWLWVAYGVLTLALLTLTTVDSIVRDADRPGVGQNDRAARQGNRGGPGQGPGVNPYACFFGLAVGCGSLYAGIRIVRGTARDVLVPSIISLLLGGMYFFIAYAGLSAPAQAPRGQAQLPQVFFLIVGFIGLTFGTLAFIPPLLALTARGRYRRWAAAQAGPYERPMAEEDVEALFPGAVCTRCEEVAPLVVWTGGLWCRACSKWVVQPPLPPAYPADEEQPERGG